MKSFIGTWLLLGWIFLVQISYDFNRNNFSNRPKTITPAIVMIATGPIFIVLGSIMFIEEYMGDNQ